MIITAKDNYRGLDEWLTGREKVLLVCDDSIRFLADFNRKLAEIKTPVVRFSDFKPNPLYDSVVEGVELFKKENCDSIFAVGGGSAMDVAKCIKLYSNMPGDGKDGAWLREKIVPNEIPFLAMPTTAGTGSEATRYGPQFPQDSAALPEESHHVRRTVPLHRVLLVCQQHGGEQEIL